MNNRGNRIPRLRREFTRNTRSSDRGLIGLLLEALVGAVEGKGEVDGHEQGLGCLRKEKQNHTKKVKTLEKGM